MDYLNFNIPNYKKDNSHRSQQSQSYHNQSRQINNQYSNNYNHNNSYGNNYVNNNNYGFNSNNRGGGGGGISNPYDRRSSVSSYQPPQYNPDPNSNHYYNGENRVIRQQPNALDKRKFMLSTRNAGFTTESSIEENYDINIKEIQKIHNEKLINKLKYYEKILQKCFFKIRQSVFNEDTFCVFTVQSYLKGFPIYNVKQCIFYIMNKLKKNGIDSKFIYPNMIFIQWKFKNTYEQIKDLQNKQYRNQETGRLEYRPSHGGVPNATSYKSSSKRIF